MTVLNDVLLMIKMVVDTIFLTMQKGSDILQFAFFGAEEELYVIIPCQTDR